MKSWKQVVGLVTLSLGALAFIQPVQAQDNLVETIRKRGKLQVGIGAFVPWAMRDKQGGLIGFEVDVATKLAKDMGVQIELMPTAWDAIIPSMIAGKFDMLNGMSITPQRKEQIDFSTPYAISGQGVAASKQLASKLKWPEDYNNANVTFVCRRAVPACKLIEEKWPKATLRQFDDDAIAFQEVINGNAHAIISSEPKPTFFALKNPDRLFKPTNDNVSNGDDSFGVRKGNPAMLAYLNDWVGKNKDWIKQRHNYWFKTQEWASLVPQ